MRRALKVSTTGSLDTVGTLFDASAQEPAEDDDSGSGINFALEADVPPGVYFVRVRAYNESHPGTYTIEEHGEPAAVERSPVGKLYWTDYGAEKIQRANLDGSRIEDLVTGLSIPSFGLALDVGDPWRNSMCAVERRCYLAGAKPARQCCSSR